MITDRKFYLPGRLTNGEGSLPIAITARIGQSGRPLMSNPDSLKLFKNLTSSFGEDFLRISSCPIVQEGPIQPSHVYGHIKILRTISEKDHPRKIPVKLFQNWTSGFRDFFKNFFMSVKCKKPPFTRAMFLDRSKFCKQFFNKRTMMVLYHSPEYYLTNEVRNKEINE